jgi:hypothetical protein
MSELPETEKQEVLKDDDNIESTAEVRFIPEPTDNVGDVSVEINVEELLNQIEEESDDEDLRCAARRRLEDIMEKKRDAKDLEDYDGLDYADEL